MKGSRAASSQAETPVTRADGSGVWPGDNTPHHPGSPCSAKSKCQQRDRKERVQPITPAAGYSDGGFAQLMGRRKEKSHSLLALPGSCVGLAALGSTPRISGGSMGFPRYSLWGERKVPGSQEGLHGTPCSPGWCHGTPQSSCTTQQCLASTVPVNAGATHPRGFQCYGTEPGAIPVPSRPSPAPRASVAACAVPRGLQAGHRVQGTCAACGAQDTPPAAGRCCAQGRCPVPRAGGCWEARASRRKPGSRREPAQPEGLGVCRARCVLGSPGSTYPAPVPTQWGAGRPAGARARSACTAPRFSPPRAAGTARDTGCCAGVRLGLREPAELSQAWDNKQQLGS